MLAVSDGSSFFDTGGFLLLRAWRFWPIIRCGAPPICRRNQSGRGHQRGRHWKAPGCLRRPAAPQHPSGQWTTSATTHDQNIYNWSVFELNWISVIRAYLWFHTPHLRHISPLSCALPVQGSTATRSRPAFTWLVPVPYPCPSPSSIVPGPSTSAGTTWRMLSSQYAADCLQFHGRKSLYSTVVKGLSFLGNIWHFSISNVV